jgi:hypothetical protein
MHREAAPYRVDDGAHACHYFLQRGWRELDRITADADPTRAALALIGGGHLLFAGRDATTLEAGAVRTMVTTVIAGVVREPSP